MLACLGSNSRLVFMRIKKGSDFVLQADDDVAIILLDLLFVNGKMHLPLLSY